jgi:hypothetical protein
MKHVRTSNQLCNMQYEIVGISVYKAMQNPPENPPETPRITPAYSCNPSSARESRESEISMSCPLAQPQNGNKLRLHSRRQSLSHKMPIVQYGNQLSHLNGFLRGETLVVSRSASSGLSSLTSTSMVSRPDSSSPLPCLLSTLKSTLGKQWSQMKRFLRGTTSVLVVSRSTAWLDRCRWL